MGLFETLRVHSALFTGFCVALGLMVGSFLNVVIYRLPKMLEQQWRDQCTELNGTEIPTRKTFNIVVPRSACPVCQHGITAIENIPLISFLFLRGKCSSCKAPISFRYPIVEAITGALSGYVVWHFGFSIAALGTLVFTWAMIALTFIDFDKQLLPDSITLPLVWAGLLFNLANTFTTLPSAIIGAVSGYLFLWCVYWLFKFATGKQGMGYGDFKLLAAIGAWLGWQMLPLVILLSSLVGAVIGTALIVIGRNTRHTPIPFGLYLALAGLIALFWGNPIVSAYIEGL